jgi:hypothetical protein
MKRFLRQANLTLTILVVFAIITYAIPVHGQGQDYALVDPSFGNKKNYRIDLDYVYTTINGTHNLIYNNTNATQDTVRMKQSNELISIDLQDSPGSNQLIKVVPFFVKKVTATNQSIEFSKQYFLSEKFLFNRGPDFGAKQQSFYSNLVLGNYPKLSKGVWQLVIRADFEGKQKFYIGEALVK